MYDKAVSDPIVCSSVRIHISYADFCVDRGKLANARKVYLKAIQQTFSDADRSNLWNRFLVLMHKINKSDELTIDQLFLAVKQQLAATAESTLVTLVPPPNVTCLASHNVHSLHTQSTSLPTSTSTSMAPTVTSNDSTTHLNGESSVQHHVQKDKSIAEIKEVEEHPHQDGRNEEPMDVESGDDLDSVIGMTPEMVVKLFNRRPPMIFTATNRVRNKQFISLFISC